jgi:hypothetical protein
VVSGSTRLIPVWYVVTAVGLLAVLTLVFAGLAATTDGIQGVPAWGLVVATGLLLVAALSSLARPRRPHEPVVGTDGSRVFLAPAATVWSLVGAWLALLVVAALWVVIGVTDLDDIESPGFALVAVLGALASLPDLARLLTGRLHRWRLELGPESISYRGYRTAETWPWSSVHGARIHPRGPAGVAIDVKGAREDPVVPITAFDVPAEQLIEEIQRAKAAAARR